MVIIVMMIGAFWNVRGLNKEGRLQCITDFVNDNSLDFVGLQETKKNKVLMSPFSGMSIRTLVGMCSLLEGLRVAF